MVAVVLAVVIEDVEKERPLEVTEEVMLLLVAAVVAMAGSTDHPSDVLTIEVVELAAVDSGLLVDVVGLRGEEEMLARLRVEEAVTDDEETGGEKLDLYEDVVIDEVDEVRL